MLGLAFKENCADLRNSRVGDVIDELATYGIDVFVHDPNADAQEAMRQYGITRHGWDALPRADAIVAAVSHRELLARSTREIKDKLVDGGSFVDVKARFDQNALREAGIKVWRL